MKRQSIILSTYCHRVFSCYLHSSSSRGRLSFLCFSRFSSSWSSGVRSFPDYSSKKPSIKDSEFVHHISTILKQRCSEPLRRILKPIETKFRSDHLIWVLMDIRNDYRLVINLFDWSCIRRCPSLEACCIVIHLAVAANDLNMAQKLFHDFWTRPSTDGSTSVSDRKSVV